MEMTDFEVEKSRAATWGDEEDRQQHQLGDNPNKRVCAVCGAVFKSGKALGGHKRIHFSVSKKALKVKSTVKFKKQVEINNLSDNQESRSNPQKEVSPKCCICPKTFRSLKSMYGHMRCHPERKWRGIKPPLDTDGLDGLDDDDVAYDLVPPEVEFSTSHGLLFSWPASYKRNRSAGKNIVPVIGNVGNFVEEDPEFLECVSNLLSLSMAPKNTAAEWVEIDVNSQISGTETLQLNRVLESEASILQEFADECVGYQNQDDEMSSPENENQLEDFNIYVSPSLNEKVISSKNDFNPKKKKPVASSSSKNMKSYHSSMVVDHKFACSVCPKSFPTYHGLGGHMSIHSKEKSVTHRLTGEESISTTHPPAVVVKELVMHQCRICKKVFSSGQALGGHKKCHRSATTLVMGDPIDGSSCANYTDGNSGINDDQSATIVIEEPMTGSYVDLDIDLNLSLEENFG